VFELARGAAPASTGAERVGRPCPERIPEEDPMAGDDSKQGPEKPSEQRGGTVPGEAEAREKGPWAGNAGEGIVPAELGGSDAPPEMLEDAPDMKDDALGRTTGSNEPATDDGIDPAAGDNADATAHGGPELPESGEVDTKDIAQAAIKRAGDGNG
jgi:hypothetical protein